MYVLLKVVSSWCTLLQVSEVVCKLRRGEVGTWSQSDKSCIPLMQVLVCKLGDQQPQRTWSGHTGDVNAVQVRAHCQRVTDFLHLCCAQSLRTV